MPYKSIEGKKIYYHQGRDFQAGLPTILFIHGAGGTGAHWFNQLTDTQGYNLIAPDLPGHGLSEGSPSDNIYAYSEFVWRFVQALELSSFLIAGHSMGGAIAFELALEHGKMLKGLIIIGSGAKLRVNPSLLEELSRDIHPVHGIKYHYSQNISLEILEKAKADMVKVPVEVFLADFRACNEFDLMTRIQNVLTPTLIICGQEDLMTPVKYSEFLSKVIPNSKIVLIKDAGHMVMIEQSKQVNRAIENFLVGI